MTTRIRTSKALFIAVKCHKLKQRELAYRADLSQSTLSQMIRGYLPIKPNDPRVRRLARVVGLPVRDAFEVVAPDAGERPRP